MTKPSSSANTEQTPAGVPEIRFFGLRGRVKWFDAIKGFGFIVGPDGEDVFVHHSEIRADGFRTLKDNALVEYDTVHGPKGLSAQNVVLIT